MPIQFLFSNWATSIAVPQPQKASKITSFSLLLALIMRSNNAFGFWVG